MPVNDSGKEERKERAKMFLDKRKLEASFTLEVLLLQ